MKILLTAGPTREPIDQVRFIGNRSSGTMGGALASAAQRAGHAITMILGPVTAPMPPELRRIDVETAAQMQLAVQEEFPSHDVLIMAAAVADYRPKRVAQGKLPRSGSLTIECEPTEDILAAAGRIKKSWQRTVGFSLELPGNLERSREKLVRKRLDLIVYNSTDTPESDTISAVLIWADTRTQVIAPCSKSALAEILIGRITSERTQSGQTR